MIDDRSPIWSPSERVNDIPDPIQREALIVQPKIRISPFIEKSVARGPSEGSESIVD